MKSLWHKLFLLGVGIFAFSMGGGTNACAQEFERMSAIEEKLYGEKAFVATDYDVMVSIKRFWYKESLRLRNRKYKFVLTGSNDCVLKVTMPASEVFSDNDTVLVASADAALRPFLKYLRGSDAIASVIVATYSDNNGSEHYLESMTEARSRNIETWMLQQGVAKANILAYGHGNKISLNGNETIKKRRQNRRVSLYLIPNKNMIKLAKKDKLDK
ncbi:MAG: OmpA family protein [Bacteroidales bacterium]|nr:OmpA family protein [Bacteroidales bacterium]